MALDKDIIEEQLRLRRVSDKPLVNLHYIAATTENHAQRMQEKAEEAQLYAALAHVGLYMAELEQAVRQRTIDLTPSVSGGGLAGDAAVQIGDQLSTLDRQLGVVLREAEKRGYVVRFTPHAQSARDTTSHWDTGEDFRSYFASLGEAVRQALQTTPVTEAYLQRSGRENLLEAVHHLVHASGPKKKR